MSDWRCSRSKHWCGALLFEAALKYPRPMQRGNKWRITMEALLIWAFRFLPAACLQSGSLKVDPGSCQPWAGLWLQACPVRRLRPFVDLGGLRGQLRSYTVKPPRLDPHSANSTYRLPPRLLLPLQSAATSDRPWYIAEHYETCFPLSQQGGLCGVLSSTICAFLQFFLFFSLSPELSTHIALQLRAIRLGAIAKGSASIRVPIIIPNQSHFSI